MDPVLQLYCPRQSCRQPALGPVRIFQGTTPSKAHLRGSIVQDCSVCRYSAHLTPAYPMEQAVDVLRRIQARQPQAPQAPYPMSQPAPYPPGPYHQAFTPPAQLPQSQPAAAQYPQTQPAPSAAQASKCPTLRCTKRISQECEYLMCKSCCQSAAYQAASSKTHRRPCKPHRLALPEPSAPSQPLQAAAPPPATQNDPAAPAIQNSPPPRASLAQPISEAWVEAQRVAKAKAVDTRGLRTTQAQDFADQGRRTANIVAYHTAKKAPTTLMLPISTYPNFQFQNHAELMDALGLNEQHFVDVYKGPRDSDWETVTPNTVIGLVPGRPLLVRSRPSFTQALDDSDCPGIEGHYARLSSRSTVSSKRQGQELVSPLKKSPRQSSEDTPHRQPSTASGANKTEPPASNKVRPAATRLFATKTKVASPAEGVTTGTTLNGVHLKCFAPSRDRGPGEAPTIPYDFSFWAFDEGEKEITRLKARRIAHSQSYPAVYSGASYNKTSICKYRRVWYDLPEEVRSEYVKKGGRKACGSKFLALAIRWKNRKERGASWWETDDESGSESEELEAESEDDGGGVVKGDDESSQTAGDGKENTDTSNTKRVTRQNSSARGTSDEGAGTKGGDPVQDADVRCGSSQEGTEVGNGDGGETAAVQSTGKARDMDRDAKESSVDRSETAVSKPGTLCPFCDEPLPRILSSALTSELVRLMSMSVPDPLPDNPLHRCLSIQHHAAFCSRHEYERKEVPKAQAQQWPLNINFYALHRRIENFQDELEAIMDDLTGSQFYKISHDSFSPGSSGGKPGPMRGFDTLDTQGAGYYGEKGFALMVEALESMFPEASYNFDAYKPVTWRAAIEEILTPELTIMLIVEDMGVSEEEAAQIRIASRVFGIHANPIEDKPTDQPTKIKEELVEPAVAEGALIDLTTPPTSPRPEAVVKTEPVEGTLKISEYNGEVIDLTLTDDEL